MSRVFVILAFLIAGSTAYGINIVASAFEIKKPEKGQVPKGVVIHYLPKKQADTFRILRNGTTLVKELKVNYSVDDIRDAIGEKTFEKIRKVARAEKSDEQLVQAMKNLDSVLVLASFIYPDFAIEYGLRYIDTEPASSQFYVVESYLNGRLQERGRTGNITNALPDIPLPDKIKAEPTHSAVKVTFVPVTGQDVLGYNVYYSKEKDGEYVKSNENLLIYLQKKDKEPLLTHHIEKLKNKTEYYVKVESVHYTFMKSDQSDPVLVEPEDDRIKTPPVITKVEQEGQALMARVNWQARDIHYAYLNVYRGESLKGPYKRINPVAVPVKENSFLDPNELKLGVTYWYRITGVTVKGDETATSVAMHIRLKKKVKPGIVAIKNVKRGKGRLTVLFTPPPDKDKLLLYYKIERRVGASKAYSEVGRVKPGTDQFVDKDVSGMYYYCYRVVAVDGFANVSKPGREKCEKPINANPLLAPSSLRAVYDQGGVVLTWEIPLNPLLKGFIIYRSDDGEIGTFSMLDAGVISKSKRLYIDKDIEPGRSYYYYIVSVAKGNIQSAPSKKFTPGVKRATAPQSVQNLVLYKKQKDCHLSWMYYDQYEEFKIQVINLETNKKQVIGKTKDKKFIWSQPKPGRYKVAVIAVNKTLDSAVREYRRVEIK